MCRRARQLERTQPLTTTPPHEERTNRDLCQLPSCWLVLLRCPSPRHSDQQAIHNRHDSRPGSDVHGDSCRRCSPTDGCNGAGLMTSTALATLLVLILLPVVLLLYFTQDRKTKARRMARNGWKHSAIAKRFGVTTQQITAWNRA